MTLREIQKAIQSLPRKEVTELAEWLDKFDSEMWEDQIRDDAKSGRFKSIYAEAVAEFESGETKLM